MNSSSLLQRTTMIPKSNSDGTMTMTKILMVSMTTMMKRKSTRTRLPLRTETIAARRWISRMPKRRAFSKNWNRQKKNGMSFKRRYRCRRRNSKSLHKIPLLSLPVLLLLTAGMRPPRASNSSSSRKTQNLRLYGPSWRIDTMMMNTMPLANYKPNWKVFSRLSKPKTTISRNSKRQHRHRPRHSNRNSRNNPRKTKSSRNCEKN
mmetsp:Transcript_18778/g.46620  ORF Transcript_18778/g.46620 Transcript_18778/m.46620 type:complete len:205 (+) Transcript_18778:217-831(+)